jgi:DNA-directed RNA polymerase I subunit RPA1
MSFETTTAFLKEATLFGFYDNMRSPSSRISLGQPNSGGTGSFDVRYNYGV